MEKNKLAVKLYDYAEVEGAPNAHVMEYLGPFIWQTLYQFFKPEKEPGVDPFQLREVIQDARRRRSCSR